MTFLLLLFSLFLQPKSHNIVFISACNEYVSHISLANYKRELESNYRNIHVTILQAKGPLNAKKEYPELEGTDVLKDCDVLLVFARRTTINGKAMDDIRQYLDAGKPLVALRTSSHGFESWPAFDKEVLGGNYSNHYRGDPEKRQMGADSMFHPVGEAAGPLMILSIAAKAREHAILKGVKPFTSRYSLYKTSPIAADATLLLTGKTEEGEEPVAWTRKYHGGNIIYIGLGGLQDWQNNNFTQLVTNALSWAGDFTLKKK